MKKITSTFIQYSIPSDLATKLTNLDLTISKCKALNKKDLMEKYGLEAKEVEFIKVCIVRQPIDKNLISLLLENSNYTCNVCKGSKGDSYIIHHIEEYSKTQDNCYNNLIVLCPNDHDLAHKKGRSLTNSISPSELRKLKEKWEKKVEKVNFDRAHKSININTDAIDFINIPRIEELLLNLFKEIPDTSVSDRLKQRKVLDQNNHFDLEYLRKQYSSSRGYVFDHINFGESIHYHELLKLITKKVDFKNIEDYLKVNMLKKGKLDHQYVFFSGGIYSNNIELPITSQTQAIKLHTKKKQKFKLEWILDPIYMYSVSAISRLGHRTSYAIYGIVRSISCDKDKIWHISIRPYLIAQPTTRLHRTPDIAYTKMSENMNDENDTKPKIENLDILAEKITRHEAPAS